MASDTEFIQRLFHYRWNVPVLATLATGGNRFVVIQSRLGASREALRTSIDALMEADLVMANPGYGHPLRPEYILTEQGKSLAAACAHYNEVAEASAAVAVAYRKWTAPVLLVLDRGRSRFNQLQDALHPVTPRALAASLKLMDAADLVTRSVTDGYPPHPTYDLTTSGKTLAGATARISSAC